MALSSISNISNNNFDECKKKATYYNAKEILDTMTEILKDPKADFITLKETLFCNQNSWQQKSIRGT